MGVLDDAIREHLELKRKRGADPAEVAEQEREALGPVRGAETATAEPPAPEIDAEPEPEPEPAPAGCAAGYSPCIAAYPPDLDCADVDGPITVTGSDPHGLDGDGDGVACES
jgi:hypothetical protein